MLPLVPVLVAALLPPPGPPAGAELLPPDARWAAVAGCVRVTGGDDSRALASAACLGAKDGWAYLLTAAHAVPRAEARVFEFFTKESYPDPAATVIGGDVVARLVAPDVALVKVRVDRAPAGAVRVAPPGQRPKRFPFPAVSVGCPAGAPPVPRPERVVGKTLVRRPGGGIAFFWVAAAPPVGGMSGGPLLDADGRLVGVMSASQGGQGYLTHLDEILAGLRREGFGWLAAP